MLSPEGGCCYSCYSCASRTSSTSSTRGGGAAGIKRQFKSILFVNYCQFFPFCGLEECAMHIDNPQMRGLFFCGVTRQACRGYDRLRFSADHRRGLNRRRECAGQSRMRGNAFSLCDYTNNIRGNGHRKESHPILILCLSYSEIPIRVQSDSNEVPMEIGGT